MDATLVELFNQWLGAFAAVEAATCEDVAAARNALADMEARIAATPAEGLLGLVVKLGMHQFLNDHGDAASEQAESAYRRPCNFVLILVA